MLPEMLDLTDEVYDTCCVAVTVPPGPDLRTGPKGMYAFALVTEAVTYVLPNSGQER